MGEMKENGGNEIKKVRGDRTYRLCKWIQIYTIKPEQIVRDKPSVVRCKEI